MSLYYPIAALLSAGWFVVMLIPANSRGWLLEDGKWHLHILFLMIAGTLVALLFRQFILSADSVKDRILRAFILPLCGSFIYLLLVVGSWWARQMVYGGLTNLHDSLSAIYMGLIGTIFSFYVVIPYGMFCQIVLEWVVKDYQGLTHNSE